MPLTEPIALPAAPAAAPTSQRGRVLSVDVLRGLTIAFMILVNDPGDWKHTYAQLDHSAWNGCTLTDLVFPNFLFLVGVSLILSLDARLARGDSRSELALHIVRRSAILFALKMAMTIAPEFAMTHLRIYGVITRIAMCYLAAGLICLFTRRVRAILAAAAVLLIGYWMLMRFVPVPGLGVPTHDFPLLDMDRNLAAWLDRGVNALIQRTLHTGVLYERTRDPEGLLSTLPSIATTLLGAATGLWMRRNRTGSAAVPAYGLARRTTLVMVVSGVLAVAAGLLWNVTFPINKNLWTSSYVLFCAGIAVLLLALFYWLIDLRGLHESRAGRILTWPWLVFGSNAIVAYTASVVFVKTLVFFHVHDSWSAPGARPTTAWSWIYSHVFARGHSTDNTSLAFALAFVLLCFIPNYLLWRRRIFLKI